MPLKEKVFAGLGEIKADTVLRHCRIVNVNTKEIHPGDIAITAGYLTGIGDVEDLTGVNTRILDLGGSYVCPGLIDGHVHFESSMLTLTQFAKQCILHGTTGIVTDPHEIANILGRKGIGLVMWEAKSLPMDVFITISSCVPSSPFETAGAALGITEIRGFLDRRFVVGLGEMMDYPDVLRGNHEKLGKIAAALERKLVVDGHAPGLRGKELFGYMGAGISSDHESITYNEAREKARLGMKIMIREGSVAKSLEDFVPKLLRDGISLENFFFATDDVHPADLLKGHMDGPVRGAIKCGVDPIQAISMATINTARHYRIDQLVGSLSIGRRANLVILDDLHDFTIKGVMVRGTIAPNIEETRYPKYVFRTVKNKKVKADDLKIKSYRATALAHVIEIVPGQLVTKRSVEELEIRDHAVQPDIHRDILPIAVIERHGKSRTTGKAFVRGFHLKKGAFGQSIAHDAHNIIVTGTNYEDMACCVNTIRELQGGMVIAYGKVRGYLPLPFAGILSTDDASRVERTFRELHGLIKEMGCRLNAPFLHLSFLSLPVIPSLKITDKGLVDVDEFAIVPPLHEA